MVKLTYGTREQRGGLKESLDTAKYIDEFKFRKLVKHYDFYCYDDRCNQIMFISKDMGNLKRPTWLFIEVCQEMVKKMEICQADDTLENLYQDLMIAISGGDINYLQRNYERYRAIGKGLREKQVEDKILKELFVFGVRESKINYKGNGTIGSISMDLAYQLVEKQDAMKLKIIRNYVMQNCFPKELKALEIIKKKEVDVSCLIFDGLEIYNENMHPSRVLTQEEYDLLKEVFNVKYADEGFGGLKLL